MFNKPDISKEGLERLNNMETMIDNNLMGLSIKNISNKENKKIENNDIQIDQNFIISFKYHVFLTFYEPTLPSS